MNAKKSQIDTSKTHSRLFLSRVPDDFDPARDLALGPWCFAGRDEDFPEWETLPFFDAFKTGKDLDSAAQDCEALAAHLILQYSRKLGKQHNKEAGLPYWWTLTSRWMLHAVTATWRRWVHIEKFIKIHGRTTLVCPLNTDAQWDFKDTADFIGRGLQSESFDLWLWSLCLTAQAPKAWTLNQETTQSDTVTGLVAGLHPPHRSSALRQTLRRQVSRIPFTDVGGTPAWAIAFFSIYLALLPKNLERVGFHGKAPKAPPANFPDAFLNLLNHVLKSTMPLTLGPGFEALDKAAGALHYVPGRIFLNGSATMNDQANFQIAHAIEAGEGVVRPQHGSDYGTMKHANIEAFSEYVAAGFLTWGWTSQSKRAGTFLPVPAPAYSQIRNGHRSKNSNIILVGTKMVLRSYRADHCLQPAQTVRYRQEKLAFIDALSPEPRGALQYRPYGRSLVDMDDGAYVARHAPDMPLLDGDLQSALLRCRLLVLDHPGTTLNMAMAANIPTICFWDPTTWPYAPEAKTLFAALAKVGVIHPDGPAAAAHLNSIHTNVQDWWTSEDVQAARQAWANQFARTSKHWWLDWARALARL